jgi:hypothetical protein
MDWDDQLPVSRNWPAVNKQANALLSTSSLYGQTKPSRCPSTLKASGLSNKRSAAIETAVKAQCRESFVLQSGNAEFISCEIAPIHAALVRVCREAGVSPVPSAHKVSDWIDSFVPGERLGQVLSFQEFVDCARALCSGLFEAKQRGAISETSESETAFGLSQRKNNATSLFNYSNPTASNTSEPSAMVLVADPETLMAAVKEDARRGRRVMLGAGQKAPPVHTRGIERDRVVETTRVGPAPSVGVRAQREAKVKAKAKRDYCRGVATSLGCNVMMVSRHLGREDDTRRAMQQMRAACGAADKQRAQTDKLNRAVELIRHDELEQRRRGRKDMLNRLETGVKQRDDALTLKEAKVRQTRDVLHWSEHTSALIPADEEAIFRKTTATSRSEWKEAVEEEETRVQRIHQQRLLGFVKEKQKPRIAHDETHLSSSAVMDGSGVLHQESAIMGFGASEPEQGRVDLSGYFYAPPQADLTYGAEAADVVPPMHMNAAQRAYSKTKAASDPETRPGFLSTASKDPLPAFYSSTISGSNTG